ncbi:mesenteric estrogen-dependent adipogenesis protein [Aulostomus maculatus]
MTDSRLTVTELEEFLQNPPLGFSVIALGSGYRVHSDPEESLVLIDEFESCGGRIVFQKSLGRTVKVENLWQYTSFRKSLLSRRIYVLVSACCCAQSRRDLKHYVVSLQGSDPFIKWQLEKGLDWTISSVAGESYRVEIDLSEALESWGAKHIRIETEEAMGDRPVWRDASFTLKYYSDALFDFPHWFGFSKRKFNLRLTQGGSG